MILRALKYYLSVCCCGCPASDTVDTTPTAAVNWEQYMGRWYEWARYENPFEYEMDNVFAEYEIMHDGKVRVTNYGTDAKGIQHKARATATIAGAGMLRVAFIPVLHFLAGSYHVLFVDETYSHALVSDKKGKCLWILGRTQFVDGAALNRMKKEAEARGFSTARLRFTHHSA